MIGALVAILSLNLSLSLIQDYGVVAGSFPITGATTTTPIVVTSVAHGVPLGRVVHGLVSGVGAMPETAGMWVCTPLSADTFALSTFDAQGNLINSIGVHAYTSGGQIQFAFPSYQILLGRRWMHTADSVTTPRVVMIPTRGAAWTFDSYGGAAPSITGLPWEPTDRGGPEQQAMTQGPQLATELLTFEIYVNGSGPNYGEALSPDFADFDATQAIVHVLYAQLFDMVGGLPRASILREWWPSQEEEQGAMTQRGQQWAGVLQLEVPVRKPPVGYVPMGTRLVETVEPVDPLVPDDQTTIVIT